MNSSTRTAIRVGVVLALLGGSTAAVTAPALAAPGTPTYRTVAHHRAHATTVRAVPVRASATSTVVVRLGPAVTITR